jgi:hypothetical protein
MVTRFISSSVGPPGHGGPPLELPELLPEELPLLLPLLDELPLLEPLELPLDELPLPDPLEPPLDELAPLELPLDPLEPLEPPLEDAPLPPSWPPLLEPPKLPPEEPLLLAAWSLAPESLSPTEGSTPPPAHPPATANAVLETRQTASDTQAFGVMGPSPLSP